MKIQYLILVLLISCATPEVIDKNDKKISSSIDSIQSKKDILIATKTNEIPLFVKNDTVNMDEFSVTDSMIRSSLREIQIDSVISYMSWFYNEKTKQVLLFEFGTDLYRVETYLFSEEYIKERFPSFLFQRRPYQKNVVICEKDAKTYFPKFIEQSKRINRSFFISKRGLKIGENISKIIEQNGKPDTIMLDKKIEMYKWKYRGDLNDWDTEAEIKANRKIARDSFGYQVILYVKNEKVIGIRLFKEIP